MLKIFAKAFFLVKGIHPGFFSNKISSYLSVTRSINIATSAIESDTKSTNNTSILLPDNKILFFIELETDVYCTFLDKGHIIVLIQLIYYIVKWRETEWFQFQQKAHNKFFVRLICPCVMRL